MESPMSSIAGIQQNEQLSAETLADTIDKLLTITAAVAVLLGSLVVLRTPPASGYELTIYQAYPLYFWGLLALAFACGVGIILHHAFSATQSRWWITGIIVVMFVNSFILLLPFIHGYAFFPRGDAMDHIGMMDDIEVTGRIGFMNFYPIVHLLGISLRYIPELPDNFIIAMLVVFFNITFLSGVYLLAANIAKKHGQALLITAFACPFFFSGLHTFIHPSMLSIYILPILLYSYHKATLPGNRQLYYKILLIILAITITYIHPVSCIFAMLLILFVNIAEYIYYNHIRNDTANIQRPFKTNFNILLIVFVIFCSWYFSFGLIQNNIKAVYYFFTSGESESVFTQQASDLANAGITASQIIMLIANQYGVILIYGILSGVAIIRVFWSGLVSRAVNLTPESIIYSLLLVLGVFFTVFSFFGFTGEMSPIRVARFFLVIAPLIMGLIIYEIATNRYKYIYWYEMGLKGKSVIFVVAILILVSGGLSIFNIYGSPRLVSLNSQVTQMDIEGTKWFGLYHNSQIIVDGVNMNFANFAHYSFGFETSVLERTLVDREAIPSNFGYDTSNSIKETYGFSDRYLVLSQVDRLYPMIVPENVRYKAHVYTGQGYEKLTQDPGASKIYSNDEFESWLVR
jgi:hypothetical protein